MEQLHTLKNNFTQNYLKWESVLVKKKDKLFQAGNASKWELSEEDKKREEELKKDKEAAFKAMLPRETARLNHLKMNHLMLSTQCYNEVRRSNKYDMELTKQNYRTIGNRLDEILKEEMETVTKVLKHL